VNSNKYTLYGGVIADAERYFDITSEEILWKRRMPHQVRARQWIWMVLHDVHKWSYPEIGKTMGFDHSTVLIGARKARKQWGVVNPPVTPKPAQWATCRNEALADAAAQTTDAPHAHEKEQACGTNT
jgi:hypothetical protein